MQKQPPPSFASFFYLREEREQMSKKKGAQSYIDRRVAGSCVARAASYKSSPNSSNGLFIIKWIKILRIFLMFKSVLNSIVRSIVQEKLRILPISTGRAPSRRTHFL